LTRYRSRAHKKPDPLDGYTDAMRHALALATKGLLVKVHGVYRPMGAPSEAISEASIRALDRRGCISWHDEDASLSTKGRVQAFIVTQRETQAANVRGKLQRADLTRRP
jgi:hypothetical protein